MHACHVCHLLLVSPPPTTPPPPPRHSTVSSMNVPTFDPSMSENGQSSTVSFTGQDTGVSLNEGIETSYNQAAGLPSQSRRILDLEFIEMSDLLPDSWPKEAQTLVVFDTQLTPRRLGRRIIVQDLSQWIECFSRMAALWAYQASIVRAARNFEGTAWVAYDRQYRRKALARRDLNWSQPNSRLYNEAFTGRAKAIPPPLLPLPQRRPLVLSVCTGATLGTGPTNRASRQPNQPSQEVCRQYNADRCHHPRCRYRHICQVCSYQHPWTQCPKNRQKTGARATEPRTFPPLARQKPFIACPDLSK